MPFQALGGPIDVKFGHQTLTLNLASNLAAEVVGDHLQSGLGRGQRVLRAGPMIQRRMKVNQEVNEEVKEEVNDLENKEGSIEETKTGRLRQRVDLRVLGGKHPLRGIFCSQG